MKHFDIVCLLPIQTPPFLCHIISQLFIYDIFLFNTVFYICIGTVLNVLIKNSTHSYIVLFKI